MRVITSTSEPSAAMLRRFVLHDSVRHRRQHYDWDCGLACVQMVLPKAEARLLAENFQQVCRAEGLSKSTWTIDLCYVLRRFNMSHSFFTRTLGTDASYRNAAFYAKVFAADEMRVNQRFREAQAQGLRVRQVALPMRVVLARLRRGPAIVLTDAGRLACSICKRNKLGEELRRYLPIPLPAPAYVGHYIVLCGYSLPSQTIYYRNPASHDHYCTMSLETFDAARCAFGTDEDIIFIESGTSTTPARDEAAQWTNQHTAPAMTS